ncbi:MAG: thiamine phosphate synthase [Fulvivirga sp.]
MKQLAGIYLVIDPKQPWESLLQKLQMALEGGINILQVWNHWPEKVSEDQKLEFIKRVKSLTDAYEVPVIMHDDWQLAQRANMDGVHFDDPPEQLSMIDLLYIGITVGNDLERIQWAAANEVSYISFCAIFPSPSVAACDIVDQNKIKQARKIIKCPIFLSGGLTDNNLDQLRDLPFDGIAVISGILNAESPKQAVKDYIEKLNEIKKT